MTKNFLEDIVAYIASASGSTSFFATAFWAHFSGLDFETVLILGGIGAWLGTIAPILFFLCLIVAIILWIWIKPIFGFLKTCFEVSKEKDVV